MRCQEAEVVEEVTGRLLVEKSAQSICLRSHQILASLDHQSLQKVREGYHFESLPDL